MPEAEEDCGVGCEFFLHCLFVRAVADDDELCVGSSCGACCADGGPGICEHGEVFFDADPADVEEFDGVWSDTLIV